MSDAAETPANGPETRRSPSTAIPIRLSLTVAGLMLIHFLLVVDTLRRKTPTVDEVAHLPAGLSYLERGSFRMYRHNPPLAKLLAALAARTAGPMTVYGRPWDANPTAHWHFGFEFQAANGATAHQRDRYLDAFTRARLVIAVWSTLTIPVLFLWGRAWFDDRAGLVAAALWTLCPNIIAHAGMITTDLAATSTGLIASFLFARWLERPGVIRLTLAGVGLGLAQLVKFSSVILGPTWLVWLIADLLILRRRRANPTSPATAVDPDREEPRLSWRGALGGFGLIVILAAGVINLGYGFEGSFAPLGEFPFVSNALTRPRQPGDAPAIATDNRTYNERLQYRVNRFHRTPLDRLPTPLPRHYLLGFDEQKFEAEGGYPQYLMGTLRQDGWWYYYPLALLWKLPLGTLLLTAAALATIPFAAPLTRARLLTLALLVILPLAAMSFLTNINIGMRYTLPILPLVFLLAGSLTRSGCGSVGLVIALAGLGANSVTELRIHPHELSYFNPVAGGPANGRTLLIDSNIDWGQDLRALVRHHGAALESGELRLAYFGSVPPEFEGVTGWRRAPRKLPPPEARLPGETEEDPTSHGPQPGRYAVSVNFERGLPFHTPCPLDRLEDWKFARGAFRIGPMLHALPGEFAWFRRFTPTFDPRVGWSILFFDISREEANAARAEMGLTPLP